MVVREDLLAGKEFYDAKIQKRETKLLSVLGEINPLKGRIKCLTSFYSGLKREMLLKRNPDMQSELSRHEQNLRYPELADQIRNLYLILGEWDFRLEKLEKKATNLKKIHKGNKI